MTAHELKTLPAEFQAIEDGDKTFAIRWDDRGYQKGDKLGLREWDPHRTCECRENSRDHAEDCPRYTGRWITADVGYVVAQTLSFGSRRGFSGAGYVVMSLILTGASNAELAAELAEAEAGA